MRVAPLSHTMMEIKPQKYKWRLLRETDRSTIGSAAHKTLVFFVKN